MGRNKQDFCPFLFPSAMYASPSSSSSSSSTSSRPPTYSSSTQSSSHGSSSSWSITSPFKLCPSPADGRIRNDQEEIMDDGASNTIKFLQGPSNRKKIEMIELEIEIAEVLYGLMRQAQGPSKQEAANDLMKFDSRDSSNNNISKSIGDANSSSSAPPMYAIAPKRKHQDQSSIDGCDNAGLFLFKRALT